MRSRSASLTTPRGLHRPLARPSAIGNGAAPHLPQLSAETVRTSGAQRSCDFSRIAVYDPQGPQPVDAPAPAMSGQLFAGNFGSTGLHSNMSASEAEVRDPTLATAGRDDTLFGAGWRPESTRARQDGGGEGEEDVTVNGGVGGTAPAPSAPAALGLMLQRACACGKQTHGSGGCEDCRTKHNLQRSAINSSSNREASAGVNTVLSTPGMPLDAATRVFMESRFGQDFSSVRVHADSLAADSARSIDARAYTVGNHIVFGRGLHDSSSHEGRRLIAHELTHTIQQRGVAPAAPQAQTFRMSRPGDSLEREADAVAGRVVSGLGVPGASFVRAGWEAGGFQGFLLQRDDEGEGRKKSEQGQSDKPLIPMPVFDEFDPAVMVPDVPGIPDFLKGQKVALSDLKKALDILRSKKKGGSDSKQICDLIPGMEIAELGKFVGQCCTKFKRDEEHCCTWRNLSIKDFRCCRKDEVLLPDNSCFKPQPAPSGKGTVQPPSESPFPKLELKVPKVRAGTIEATTIDKFALNSATIPGGHEKELDHLAGLLKIYKDAEIHIEGHTDSSYTEDYNQTLSEKRAGSVKNALVKLGVSTAKMTVVGFGKTQLRFSAESNEQEKAGNRRVDIWFYTPPSKPLGGELHLDLP
jgi:outer membrane protein OmpA-like peptidoglycan-associated protein